MAFIQPLDLYEILVNQLAGSSVIFVLLMVFFIASMGAAFRMSGLLISSLTVVFFLMLNSVEVGIGTEVTGMFGIMLIFLSIILAKTFHELMAR